MIYRWWCIYLYLFILIHIFTCGHHTWKAAHGTTKSEFTTERRKSLCVHKLCTSYSSQCSLSPSRGRDKIPDQGAITPLHRQTDISFIAGAASTACVCFLLLRRLSCCRLLLSSLLLLRWDVVPWDAEEEKHFLNYKIGGDWGGDCRLKKWV